MRSDHDGICFHSIQIMGELNPLLLQIIQHRLIMHQLAQHRDRLLIGSLPGKFNGIFHPKTHPHVLGSNDC